LTVDPFATLVNGAAMKGRPVLRTTVKFVPGKGVKLSVIFSVLPTPLYEAAVIGMSVAALKVALTTAPCVDVVLNAKRARRRSAAKESPERSKPRLDDAEIKAGAVKDQEVGRMSLFMG
jgi:hypothetical protein